MTRCLPLAVALMVLVGFDAEARTIFVSNEKGNSISIIDGDSLELIEEIAVGQRPRGHRARQGRQASLYLRLR